MSGDALAETAEELFEDAPCGYLATDATGTVLRVNRTFEALTGHRREDLVGLRRFGALLAVGDRIYYETHLAPLLRLQGEVTGIAVEVLRADGTRLPALINATLREPPGTGDPLIRITVFDATDRRRYEQELMRARARAHEIALELQRGLLAGALPDDDRLDVGLLYRPGVTGAEAGGDWYDVFRIDDDVVALVVGDVVGRGIPAATTMGQLRAALRALAADRPGPGALLEALDGYAARHATGAMTTVLAAELDLRSRELRVACAGHPPPIVAQPGGAAEVLWGGRSLPLDAAPEPVGARPETVCRLAPGSKILLYTDGLVERAGLPIDAGIAELAARFGPLREAPAADVAAALGRTVPDGGDRDDVCVLVAGV